MAEPDKNDSNHHHQQPGNGSGHDGGFDTDKVEEAFQPTWSSPSKFTIEESQPATGNTAISASSNDDNHVTGKPSLCPVCSGELIPLGGTVTTFGQKSCQCIDSPETSESKDRRFRTSAALPKLFAFPSDALVGQVLFGNFKILDRIGEGTTGVVYKAQDLSFDKFVAVKTVKTKHPEMLTRFAREVKTHSQLRHENIVDPVVCLDSPAGQPFFVMEYLEGITLEGLLSAGRFKTEDEVATIALQVCDALHYAHQKKVIHRDLTPSNILIVKSDGKLTAKVVDFGLAKLEEDLQGVTHEGEVLGSPLYMSPEQCRGHRLSTRSDIYSLGLIVYEMVAGEAAYERDSESIFDVMTKHCDTKCSPLPISTLSPHFGAIALLEQVISKATATLPEERYQTVLEFKRDLKNWWQTACPNQIIEVEQDAGEGIMFLEAVEDRPPSPEWLEELKNMSWQEYVATAISPTSSTTNGIGNEVRNQTLIRNRSIDHHNSDNGEVQQLPEVSQYELEPVVTVRLFDPGTNLRDHSETLENRSSTEPATAAELTPKRSSSQTEILPEQSQFELTPVAAEDSRLHSRLNPPEEASADNHRRPAIAQPTDEHMQIVDSAGAPGMMMASKQVELGETERQRLEEKLTAELLRELNADESSEVALAATLPTEPKDSAENKLSEQSKSAQWLKKDASQSEMTSLKLDKTKHHYERKVRLEMIKAVILATFTLVIIIFAVAAFMR